VPLVPTSEGLTTACSKSPSMDSRASRYI
jgi:hypothetical protein